MQKYKAKKEVIEELQKKIKTSKNSIISPEFAEKLQNKGVNRGNNGKLEEISPNQNKNIFARGDFDDYKISDEELEELEHDINKTLLSLDWDELLKSHKYSRKEFKNGKWIYYYNKHNNHARMTQCKSPLLTFKYDKTLDPQIQTAMITGQAIDYIENTWLADWEKPGNENKSICKELRNKKIIFGDISYTHLWKQGGNSNGGVKIRTPKNILEHVPYLACAKELLEDNGVWTESRYEPINKKHSRAVGIIYQTISGIAPVGSPKPYVSVTISQYKYKNGKKGDALYISVVGKDDIKKSLDKKNGLDLSKGGNTSFATKAAFCSTSPKSMPNNILPNFQNKSSNINKSLTYSGHKLQGRTKLYGMDISIENKKGSYRSGVDSDGHKWRTYMNYDYGYIRGTVGVDHDHLDVYCGPDKTADKVYVIHQNNPVTHEYDEDKCMLCFESADAAKKAYMKQYDRPGFFGSMETLTIEQFKSFVFSKQGKRIHKSFDITITDITENNKERKIEQLEKSLNAIYENKSFVVKHIKDNDNSQRYNDITLRIHDFDKSKIEKAVHSMAFSLDTKIKSAKGEAFNFKAQEELTDRFVSEMTEKTKDVYTFVIAYFGLPEIRVVSKANLTYKGKVIFNPENGKPITKAEWKKFVEALEKFLNRNYDGVGERIVLSAESLGIILERMSKVNTLTQLKKLHLDDLEVKNKKFDWISENVKNMHDIFGDTLTRERAARVEVAMDSAAQRVTRVKDSMRNDIQQIIIDGVKNKESKARISQNLFDTCVGLNRDFQKIADTEIQNNTNNAYLKEEVYNSNEGEKVYFKRFEIIDDNTCKKCKAIKNEIALWSDVALPDENIDDPYAKYAIWEGKTDGKLPVSVLHPYCYSDDTEVMTNNGWKLFKDVLDDDLIMSINPDTHEIDFVPFIKRISYQYDGEMIHFPGRNFDMLVTPNHNILIEERYSGKWHGIKAEDLIDKTIYQIPRARGLWNGSNSEKIKIGCVEYSYIQYIKLWAWYLSEGSGRKKSDNAYEIKLAQKNINKILDDIPEFSERFIKGKEALYCTGKIAEMFEQMYGIYAADKYIPDFIKNSSAECIRAFLYSFNLGDGSKRSRENIKNNSLGIKKSNDFVVRTSSKKMADDLCELIIKAGWMPSIHVTKQKGKEVMFRNGTYKLNTDCYVINICKSKNKVYSKHVHPGHPESHLPYKLNYSGMVYDVELEKWHFLLVKRNGKCGWSGNCRGSWFRYYPELD